MPEITRKKNGTENTLKYEHMMNLTLSSCIQFWSCNNKRMYSLNTCKGQQDGVTSSKEDTQQIHQVKNRWLTGHKILKTVKILNRIKTNIFHSKKANLILCLNRSQVCNRGSTVATEPLPCNFTRTNLINNLKLKTTLILITVLYVYTHTQFAY